MFETTNQITISRYSSAMTFSSNRIVTLTGLPVMGKQRQQGEKARWVSSCCGFTWSTPYAVCTGGSSTCRCAGENGSDMSSHVFPIHVTQRWVKNQGPINSVGARKTLHPVDPVATPTLRDGADKALPYLCPPRMAEDNDPVAMLGSSWIIFSHLQS